MQALYPWHEDTWQRWRALHARLPHALLLKGPQGTGKLDFAYRLARSLLCEMPGANSEACGNCPACHWFEQETHPDFRLLQPEALAETEEGESGSRKKPSRQISVEQVRALSDFANLSAHQGGRRVVLIHPAELMNVSAANALLKTLEEPTPNMVLLLVSHKPQQLLPTIRSRCVALAMPMPAPQLARDWLKAQGVAKPDAALAQSGYAPLEALRLAREESDAADHDSFLREIGQPARMDALALAERMQKTEPAHLIHWLQQWCYDLSSARLSGAIRYHPEAGKEIRSLAGKIPPLALSDFQKELLTARREALHPLNPRLLFESLLLAYQQMAASAA